ncbi:MAG: GMC family oxidoreductase N-terminal domain-containing protein [Chitinophagales bacterium]|nr:GMC family oxidoreductase N-terminal domain-containing protein [Chitinophagales bacterium]
MGNNVSRRRFLGYSALLTAVGLGLTTISCKKDAVSLEDDYDAIIIGSGFGGAVCALRLCEAGKKTLLIEMGKAWFNEGKDIFSPNFPPDKRSTWLNGKTELPFGPTFNIGGKYAGVMDKVSYQNMSIYRNVCLGGGSISNGGVLLLPKETHFNAFMFSDINYGEVVAKADIVKQMMSAAVMPEDLFNSSYYQYAQLTKRHALNAGLEVEHAYSFYDFDMWRKELNGDIKKSALAGELLYGNNNGIKKSLEKNYLAAALGTGHLTISTLSHVEEVRVLTDGQYEVNIQRTNEFGDNLDKKTFNAKHLFVCAGSIGTSEILVKARETGGLPDLTEDVGKHWGGNGMSFAFRSGLDEPTGSIHASPPTLTVKHHDNPIAPVNAMQDIFPLGLDLRMVLMVGQPYNETHGQFNYDSGNGTAILTWPENGNEQGALAMRTMIERLNDANGGKLDTAFIPEGVSQSYTYHPLGGAVLGKASDAYGRLKGYKNLYAIDGSMLPGNCGLVNPTLVISALAERNIERILSEDFS